MRESCGMRGSHPTCKTMNTQYDAFFKRFLSVKITVQHLTHMHCLGEFHGYFYCFLSTFSFVFSLHLCAKGSVCDVCGVAYYNR